MLCVMETNVVCYAIDLDKLVMHVLYVLGNTQHMAADKRYKTHDKLHSRSFYFKEKLACSRSGLQNLYLLLSSEVSP